MSTLIDDTAKTLPDGSVAVQLVDCDVHPEPASIEELRDHLPAKHKRIPDSLLTNTGLYMPPAHPSRLDAVGPDGGKAGSDPEFTERQLLGEAGVDVAILDPLVRRLKNPTYELALCQATNDWLHTKWLSRGHARFKGSIKVPSTDPAGAVREIERWAGHPHFIQVWMDMYADAPFGDPQYIPIFEAAARHGYPIGVHFAKSPGLSLATPVGFLNYYFEHHSLFPMGYSAHLVSLICQGTFDKIPGLRFAFLEGGCGWMLPLLWRLENHWDDLSKELPHEPRRRPWDYVREHVRWATQPIEEPPERRHLSLALELMEADRLLMFSSDYPHWDYDDPSDVFRRLTPDSRERIFARNAIEFYGLPDTRPQDDISADV
jgi:predicted TIM-barrel fold metal-dependent hydrolase